MKSDVFKKSAGLFSIFKVNLGKRVLLCISPSPLRTSPPFPSRATADSPCPPSVLQDRSDNEVEKVKGSLILCYGYVARHAPRELVLARIDADILRNIFVYFHTKVSVGCVSASRQRTGWAAGRRFSSGIVNVSPFYFVQVLGIKVETKVPC